MHYLKNDLQLVAFFQKVRPGNARSMKLPTDWKGRDFGPSSLPLKKGLYYRRTLLGSSGFSFVDFSGFKNRNAAANEKTTILLGIIIILEQRFQTFRFSNVSYEMFFSMLRAIMPPTCFIFSIPRDCFRVFIQQDHHSPQQIQAIHKKVMW